MAKKKITTKPPSGMRDFLPAELGRRQHVFDVVRRVYGRYGFVPIETPSIENLTTLLGKYGEEGDQLLYRLLHRRDALTRALAKDGVGEADLADKGLRYDLTVPLARVVAQYGDLPKFFKRYQIQPVWRADRPGKGRYREFYQCDVDVTGTTSPLAEADVCAAGSEVLRELGLTDHELRVNHRGVLRAMVKKAGVDPKDESSALIAVDKLDKIGMQGVMGELTERGITEESAKTLLMLVCCEQLLEPHSELYTSGVVDEQQATGWGFAGVAALGDQHKKYGGDERYEHLAPLYLLRRVLAEDEEAVAVLDSLEQLFELLMATPAGPHARFSPSLARGLSYYNGAIFEVAVPDFKGSIAGGGRYDDLVGMFGKRAIPAVGLSLGLDRIVLVLEQRELFPPPTFGPQVVLCWMDVPLADVLKVAHTLRGAGVRVEIYPEHTRKLGKQLQYADAPGVKAPVVAILGANEVEAGTVSLKHLGSGDQVTVPLGEAATMAKEMAARTG